LLNNIQELSGSIVQNAAQQLRDASTETGVMDMLRIADDWGMNNNPFPAPTKQPEELPEDSLL